MDRNSPDSPSTDPSTLDIISQQLREAGYTPEKIAAMDLYAQTTLAQAQLKDINGYKTVFLNYLALCLNNACIDIEQKMAAEADITTVEDTSQLLGIELTTIHPFLLPLRIRLARTQAAAAIK
ncbi:MAG: hypothetical protein HY817_04480 [Candidatus Abawacabacteria bacterium]|nr:hypothetical protein [Candidatus Abawacabacteria bacterium]